MRTVKSCTLCKGDLRWCSRLEAFQLHLTSDVEQCCGFSRSLAWSSGLAAFPIRPSLTEEWEPHIHGCKAAHFGPSDCDGLHPIPLFLPNQHPAPERRYRIFHDSQDSHDVHICTVSLLFIANPTSSVTSGSRNQPHVRTRQGRFLSQRRRLVENALEGIETGRDHDSGP
jgi:hypothetical protein